MNRRRFIRKSLSLLLACAFILALAPTAFAEEDMPWAEDAVSALNKAYGVGTFTADDDVVTRETAKDLFTGKAFLSEADANDIFGVDTPAGNLTRAELCAAVSKTLRLEFEADPTEYFGDCGDLDGQKAIGVATLASLGVISGRGPRQFDPLGIVMNAELAVIFYRALNAAAGGTAGWFKNLKPGQYGYFEALYLMVRVEGGSFDRERLSKDTAFGGGFSIDTEITRDSRVTLGEKDEIIEYWKMRLLLEDSWPEGVNAGLKGGIIWPQEYENNVLDAIVALVTAYRAVLPSDKAGIFSDVSEGDWYYDGVMYLCNNGIVIGTGKGRFAPDDGSNNAELLALTARIRGALGMDKSESAITAEYNALKNDGEPESWDTYFSDFDSFGEFESTFTDIFEHPNFIVRVEEGPEELLWAAPYFWVFRDKYLDGGEGPSDIDPLKQVTREKMADAAYELYKEYKHKDLDGDVNTAILDRFSDKDNISQEYRMAMAYLVSIGALSGDESGNLLPEEHIKRSELGVFFSRLLRGLDSSKMYDYKIAASNAIGG